ncbi:hypothetical protein U9M48_024743, partial [Paspalum notatum var. saurae]
LQYIVYVYQVLDTTIVFLHLGQAKECENAYSELFDCKSGSFPFRYLGLPKHYRKLRNSDRRHIEERFEKRLIGWKGMLLSVGGRLVLINSVVSSLPIFVKPKEQWGLGIIDLEVQNKCLLSKWLYKLTNEDGIWQSLLRNKYLKSKPLGAELKGQGFLTFGLVRFWKDTWCGNRPLKFLYPSLFNIVRKKGVTMADVKRSIPLDIS